MSSIEEYTDLADTGFYGGGGGETIPPEEEFFHSVYVSGKNRKNHINIVEQSGKLQIRGVQYNLEEVNMIITHTKDVLANVIKENKKDNLKCFSFKEGAPPWFGTSKLSNGQSRQCPQTSAERIVNDFCKTCKAQIILAGIYCKADGTPILTEDKKPIFIFLRGKGMKYANVSNYLNERFKEDLDPIFTPVTEQTKRFEKSVVNNKRYVTKITAGEATSSFGNDVSIFVMTTGPSLEKDAVMQILKLSKQTVSKFNDKFDWSKGKASTGYGTNQVAPGVMTFDNKETTPEENTNENKSSSQKPFSFDDINF